MLLLLPLKICAFVEIKSEKCVYNDNSRMDLIYHYCSVMFLFQTELFQPKTSNAACLMKNF